jgi:hypothetical protein
VGANPARPTSITKPHFCGAFLLAPSSLQIAL